MRWTIAAVVMVLAGCSPTTDDGGYCDGDFLTDGKDRRVSCTGWCVDFASFKSGACVDDHCHCVDGERSADVWLADAVD